MSTVSASFNGYNNSNQINAYSAFNITLDEVTTEKNVTYSAGLFKLQSITDYDVEITLNLKGSNRGWIVCEVGGLAKESYYFENNTTNEGSKHFHFYIPNTNQSVSFYLYPNSNHITLQRKSEGDLYQPAISVKVRPAF
jgi:hypothetical protein